MAVRSGYDERPRIVKALVDAAVGMFAEAGYVTRVRTLVPPTRHDLTADPDWEPSHLCVTLGTLRPLGFGEVSPSVVYLGLECQVF